MRVLLVPMDAGACSFYRITEPARVATSIGVDVAVQAVDLPVDAFNYEDGSIGVAEFLYDCDVLVLQRPLAQNVHAIAVAAKRQGIRIVVELDDWLHKVHRDNAAAESVDPAKQPWHNWQWTSRTIQLADLLTVSTPTLAQYAPEKAVVVRNRVPAACPALRPAVSPARGVVGWTGSVGTHPEDLQATRGALRAVDAPVRVVGMLDGVAEALRVSRDRVTLGSPWVEPIPVYWQRVAENIGVGIAPLQTSNFNRAKCLDSETRIATDHGVLRIADVTDGMRVLRNGAWRSVLATRQELPRPGVLLTTDGGYQLRLTPEHRMLVDGTWKQASEIKVGDRLSLESEPQGPTEYQVINWPGDSRMSRSGSGFSPTTYLSASDGPKLTITPRWGRFLGAFAGDGSTTPTGVCISCDGQDPDWIQLMMNDLAEMSVNPATERQVRTFSGELIRRRHVKASSAHLVRVLENIGVVRRKENGQAIRHVCVPEVIWRSPHPVIAEFLAGYFEADGTTTNCNVNATSKSETLLRGIQRLLLLFGIASRVTPKIGKAQNGFVGNYWMITLRRASADIFEKEIGFRSERKMARLAAITCKPHSNAYKPIDWYPPVTAIEPCVVTPVDLQVAGAQFTASGFISHNSALKPMEYLNLGIPYIASSLPEYEWITNESHAGIVARSQSEWVQALRTLLNNDREYERLRANGAEWAEANTLERHIGDWVHAWERAMDTGKTRIAL